MSEYREQALGRLDGRTLGRVGGGSLQLVTVCLTDEGAGEICDEHDRPLDPTLPVLAYLRPSEARELPRAAKITRSAGFGLIAGSPLSPGLPLRPPPT